MTNKSLKNAINAVKDALMVFKPRPELTLTEWSEKSFFISKERSSRPGFYSSDNAPYQREMVDITLDENIQYVSYMLSAQSGKNMCQELILGYHIEHKPCGIMYVMPTEKDAKGLIDEKIDPFLRDNKNIGKKLKGYKRRWDFLQFDGGFCNITSASSSSAVHGHSVRVAIMDECDQYQKTDTFQLIDKRTTSFTNKLVLTFGTPEKSHNLMYTRFKKGDQREWYMPCPSCGHFHYYQLEDVKYDEKDIENTVHLECPNCSYEINEIERKEMIRNGKWMATAKPELSYIASFHLNQIASPFAHLRDLVVAYEESKGNEELTARFYRAYLGLPYDIGVGERKNIDSLIRNIKQYDKLSIPNDVEEITIGVDTQNNRLEASCYGYAKNYKSYLIEHQVLYGDPSESDVFKLLNEFITQKYQRQDGKILTPSAIFIDTGGQRTQYVYDYTVQCQKSSNPILRKVVGIKGDSHSSSSSQIVKKESYVDIKLNNKVNKRGAKIRLINVNKLKEYVAISLQKDNIFFYKNVDSNVLEQIIAEERRIEKDKYGGFKEVWYLADGVRNEALDTLVYANAAAYASGVFLRLNSDKKQDDDISTNEVKSDTIDKTRHRINNAFMNLGRRNGIIR